MTGLPKRKPIRIDDYDYATPGAYFVTLCAADRAKIFWNRVGADIIRPENVPLSAIGRIAEQSILQIPTHYEHIAIDKFCIMPDHIHLIVRIESDSVIRADDIRPLQILTNIFLGTEKGPVR